MKRTQAQSRPYCTLRVENDSSRVLFERWPPGEAKPHERRSKVVFEVFPSKSQPVGGTCRRETLPVAEVGNVCPRWWAVFVAAQAHWDDFCAVVFVVAEPMHGDASPQSYWLREKSCLFPPFPVVFNGDGSDVKQCPGNTRNQAAVSPSCVRRV